MGAADAAKVDSQLPLAHDSANNQYILTTINRELQCEPVTS